MNHAVAGIRTRHGSETIPSAENGFAPRPGLALDRPNRILMTTSGRRQTWAHTLDLAGALGSQGIEVMLASIGEAPNHVQIAQASHLPNVQVFPNRFAAEYSDDAWDEVERAGAWLLRLESTLQPDLVHLGSYPFGSFPFEAPTLLDDLDCPLCRWRTVHDEATPLLWQRYRRSVSRALADTGMVITPTRSALDDLTGLFGAPRSSRVIPIGRSAHRFVPHDKRERVLSAGCFGDEAQNLSALEEVARRLDWPVTVLVDGFPGCAEEGAERPVEILQEPSDDELTSAYGEAAIFALPCSYEPTGISVLEAALSGCALVLGDVPALREIWQGAALFVAPGDPDDLERAIDLLTHEPKGRRGLGKRAHGRALLLSPERRAASFLETYAQLLRQPSLPVERDGVEDEIAMGVAS